MRLVLYTGKGGVGKTTTAVNLAACLAASERPTLLIDMDPQANASSAYGITKAERQIYDALIDETPLSHCAYETELETRHVIPAGRGRRGPDIERQLGGHHADQASDHLTRDSLHSAPYLPRVVARLGVEGALSS